MSVIISEELVEAATEGEAGRVRELLEQGVAPDARDEQGRSALSMACARGHTEIVQALLDHGADPDGAGVDPSPARAACTVGGLEALRLLLAAGADPNAEAADGQSLLIGVFLAEGTTRMPVYLELAGLLLEAGAEIDAADRDGVTALTRAVILDRSAAVRWLLAHAADANLGGSQGLGLLEIARVRGQEEIAQLLLAGGAVPKED